MQMPRKSRQIIISGATGFVGRHVVPLFLEHGYDVIATARDQNRAASLEWFDRVTFVPANFHKTMPDIQCETGAGLIHLAWQGLPNYKSSFHYEDNLFRNYDFIKFMVSRGIGQVLVAGTCFEYGDQNGPLPSSTRPNPNNSYAMAKDTLRRFLEALTQDHPFTLQWARLFYMYGQGQNPKSLLSQLDAAIDAGQPGFNMSGGEQLRDYLPVQDVARQIFDLYEKQSPGSYNICSGTPVSVRRLVERHIAHRQATITPNLGHYPYPDHEPMAFWGVRDIGQTFFLPSLPNSPLATPQATQALGPMRLRYNSALDFLENEAFDPNIIDYNAEYQNNQSHSPRFRAHMRDVLEICRKAVPNGGHIVEVGCGKGDFVKLVREDGSFRITGFDAAYEGNDPAIEKRYLTSADRLKADIVVLRHVLEHISQPHRFVDMLATIFGNAKLYIEVPSYEWIVRNKTFFDITYEHVNYFTQTTLQSLFKKGLSESGLLFEGQYQYVLSDFASRNLDFNVLYASSWSYPTFDTLFPDMERKIETIERTAHNGSVFLWGAATKGCLFLAHCAMRNRLIDRVRFAIDINPAKIGKFLPGSLVEIRSRQEFFATARPGDTLLIANPAYRAEIEQEITACGLNGILVETL